MKELDKRKTNVNMKLKNRVIYVIIKIESMKELYMNVIKVNIILYGIMTNFIKKSMNEGYRYKCNQCEYKAT